MPKTKRVAQRQDAAGAVMPDHAVDAFMQLIAEALQDVADPVAQFADYLDGCGDGDADQDRDAQIAELIGELNQLRIASGDGDRGALDDVRAVYDLLNSALDRGSLGPIDLIMTGKIFHDAGWLVPDALKQAVGHALQSPANDAIACDDLPAILTDLAHNAGGNPFEIHELLNSMLAALPSSTSAHLLARLAGLHRADVNNALVGFMLHPDAAITKAAADALLVMAAGGPVESLVIERLIHMRPWLPRDRQAHLDSLVRTLRPRALPPQKRSLPKLVDGYASVCDGSGAQSVSIVQCEGGRHKFVSVLIRPPGIGEVVAIPELPKSEIALMIGQMKSAAQMSKTGTAGIARMLGLALAGNAASGDLPPFRLIEVVESLGLPPLHPDHASAAEIAGELLKSLPEEQTNADAAAEAHAILPDEELVEQWFEPGEAVDDLLRPLKTRKQRVTALMAAYLPLRRQFWARQCAISALALHMEPDPAPWKQLALVGRDIASDMPVERIPLMRQIAEASVAVFESQY